MTDKDIIKALECCGIKTDCKGCYFDTHESEDICAREIVKNAFDLLNRQKEEIEFLRKTIGKNDKKALDVTLEEIEKYRVEAIIEFAERLKQTITNEINTYYNSNGSISYLFKYQDLYKKVSNGYIRDDNGKYLFTSIHREAVVNPNSV